jgi:putative FmdB family regulatory protein
MPIYEFRCSGCKKRFEKLCVMGETGEGLTCPNCGAVKPTRVMSSFKSVGSIESNFENDFAENNGFNNKGCSSCSAPSCSSCGY